MRGKTWVITLLIMWAVPTVLFRCMFNISWPASVGFGALVVALSGGKI